MFKIAHIEYAEIPTRVPNTVYSGGNDRIRECKYRELPEEYISQIREKLRTCGTAFDNDVYYGADGLVYSVTGFVYNTVEHDHATDKVQYMLERMNFKVSKNKLPVIQETLTRWRTQLNLESFIGKHVTLNELPLNDRKDYSKPCYQYKDSKLELTLGEHGGSMGAFNWITTTLAPFATVHLTTVDDKPITKWCTHCGTIA